VTPLVKYRFCRCVCERARNRERERARKNEREREGESEKERETGSERECESERDLGLDALAAERAERPVAVIRIVGIACTAQSGNRQV
jgi:hypothetical protein